jgi:hypothetical protein
MSRMLVVFASACFQGCTIGVDPLPAKDVARRRGCSCPSDSPCDCQLPNHTAKLGLSRFERTKPERHNSDVEADVALSRCAPSRPRSLTPVVRPTRSPGDILQPDAAE